MKKLLAITLSALLLMACVPLGAISVAAEATSGITGDCTWTLDGTHLTISGEGKMGNSHYGKLWGTGITSVTIEDGVSFISNGAFYKCSSLTTATIPSSVTSIGGSAFEDCSSLTSLIIPNGITTIDNWTFSGCSSLTSFSIPESVVSIGDFAFHDCSSISTFTIPDSVTSIGEDAFASCDSLTSIKISDNVVSIGKGAFESCDSLTTITVDESNCNYSSQDNVLFNKDQTTLLQYPSGKSDNFYAIPNSVTALSRSAFSGCSALTSIFIPSSVTAIEMFAFSGHLYLTDIYYGGNEQSREDVVIGGYNDPLLDATWHYNYVPEPTVTPGDANGDGSVNNRDLGMLQQHLNGWGTGVDTAALDLNNDGKVNNRDLGLLQQHLNGWGVGLG